jgi:hypothetical protein
MLCENKVQFYKSEVNGSKEGVGMGFKKFVILEARLKV